jgi:mono/diheme cytochrome c family protein
MAIRSGRLAVAGSLVLACALAANVAAQAPSGGQKPVVKGVRAVPIQSVEGKDNFEAYCAVCHGRDAKGTGPAAPAMKVPVPDLTTIARRNQGRFDASGVEEIIRGTGRTATPAHGVEDMPIWGEVFRYGDPSVTRLRIGNLVKYVQSLQAAGSEPAAR